MKNKKEKTENSKALPKFLVTIVVATLIGGGLGYLSGIVGATNLPQTVVQGLYRVLKIFAPWSIWVSSAVLLGVGIWKYRAAKRLFLGWDGEDEESMEKAEEQLNWTMLANALGMILNYSFFAIGVQLLDVGMAAVGLFLSFILSMVVMTVLQQKVVDLTRQMNPEKRGSIYDMKFQKKWLASCDENELRQMGQAAYKAFTAVTYTCVGLWAILVLLAYVLDVGILPVCLVMLIWGVSQVTYVLECIRLGRHR